MTTLKLIVSYGGTIEQPLRLLHLTVETSEAEAIEIDREDLDDAIRVLRDEEDPGFSAGELPTSADETFRLHWLGDFDDADDLWVVVGVEGLLDSSISVDDFKIQFDHVEVLEPQTV